MAWVIAAVRGTRRCCLPIDRGSHTVFVRNPHDIPDRSEFGRLGIADPTEKFPKRMPWRSISNRIPQSLFEPERNSDGIDVMSRFDSKLPLDGLPGWEKQTKSLFESQSALVDDWTIQEASGRGDAPLHRKAPVSVARRVEKLFAPREGKEDRQGKIDRALEMILIHQIKERQAVRILTADKRNDAVRNRAASGRSQLSRHWHRCKADTPRTETLECVERNVRKRDEFAAAVADFNSRPRRAHRDFPFAEKVPGNPRATA